MNITFYFSNSRGNEIEYVFEASDDIIKAVLFKLLTDEHSGIFASDDGKFVKDIIDEDFDHLVKKHYDFILDIIENDCYDEAHSEYVESAADPYSYVGMSRRDFH